MIVKVFQGPGNQLFQYAYGLAASKRVGAELKLDLSWFDSNSSHRSYILDRFKIETPIASREEIEFVRTCNGQNFLEYRFNRLRNDLAPRHKKAVVKEDLSVFDEKLKCPFRNSHIEGYFSTEKFFDDSMHTIRHALQFRNEMSEPVSEIATSIDSNTVALSIRRGDFLGNPLHNICSVQYFQRAIELMSTKVENPKYLVFSDEREWVLTNMKFGVSVTVIPSMSDPMDHMRLMSLCQNHIIPNSTYSWWGAWLSDPNIVIAPDIWLSSDRAIHMEKFGHWVETNHTVPNGWVRIPAYLTGETMM